MFSLFGNLVFHRNWRIEDVETVLGRFRAHIGLTKAPSDIMSGEASSVRAQHHTCGSFSRVRDVFQKG